MKEKALFVFAFDKKHQIKSVFPLGLHNLKNKICSHEISSILTPPMKIESKVKSEGENFFLPDLVLNYI